MNGWRAHVTTDWPYGDHRRVVFCRPWGDSVQFISGFDEHGMPVIEERPADTRPDFHGLLIPTEALEALAEMLKPGPSQGETKRLDEALSHERKRVDDMLARARIEPA